MGFVQFFSISIEKSVDHIEFGPQILHLCVLAHGFTEHNDDLAVHVLDDTLQRGLLSSNQIQDLQTQILRALSKVGQHLNKLMKVFFVCDPAS